MAIIEKVEPELEPKLFDFGSAVRNTASKGHFLSSFCPVRISELLIYLYVYLSVYLSRTRILYILSSSLSSTVMSSSARFLNKNNFNIWEEEKQSLFSC